MSTRRPFPRKTSSCLLLCFAAAALGCGGDDPPPSSTPSTASASAANKVTCATDPRVTQFASGVAATSTTGRFGAEILNASPSPPRRAAGGTGLNDWTMKFQIENAPLPAADTLTVTSFMPDHGHGSSIKPQVSLSPDGTYAVKGLYFFMAGVWEVSFHDGDETTKFTFCIE